MDDKLHLEKIKSEIIDLAKEYFQINKNDVFIPNISSVPVSGKVLDENELKLMVDASLDGWLTTGRFNEEFEKKLAHFLGVKYLLTRKMSKPGDIINLSRFIARNHKTARARFLPFSTYFLVT